MAEQDNFLKKFLEFAEKIKLIEKVYKEDKNGEYSIVSAEQLDNINRTIEEFNKMIEGLKSQIDKEHVGMLSGIETIFKGLELQSSKIDIDQVNKIFQEAVEKINKTQRISVSPELETDKNGNLLKGGRVNVARVFEGDEQKKGGGAIMQPRKGNNYQIDGEFANIDKTVEILWDAARKLDKLQPKEQPDLKTTKESVKQEVKKSVSALKKETNKAQKELKKITGISKFVGKYIPGRNLKIAAFATLLGVHAVAGLSGGAEYSVAGIESLHETEEKSEDEIDKIMEETQGQIDKGANEETIKESNTVNREGKTQDNIDEEVSNTKNERNEKLVECKEKIKKIIDDYNEISNPTNEEYLNYISRLSDEKKESLELLKATLEEDNAYYQEFIELNEAHIAKSSSSWGQETIDRHYSEIEHAEEKIDKNTERSSQIVVEIGDIDDKKEFLKEMQQLSGLEDVKNIEDISEALYKFSKTDMAQEITDGKNLMQYLEDENVELNLFSAYTKLDFKSVSPEEFVEGYKLLENTYTQYLEEYCQGDNAQVDEGKYAQYFKNALQFEDGIGKSGFITTIQALIGQNNLNSQYYAEYGNELTKTEKENTFFTTLIENIKTFFDRQRIGEYKDTVEEIEGMYNGVTVAENLKDSETSSIVEDEKEV